MTEPRADAPVEGKLTLEIASSESGPGRAAQDAFMARLLAKDSGEGPLQELASVLGEGVTRSIRLKAYRGRIVFRGEPVGYDRDRAMGFVDDAIQNLWVWCLDRRDDLRARWDCWPGGLSRFLIRMAHEKLHQLTRSPRSQGRPVTSVDAQEPAEPWAPTSDDPQHLVSLRELLSISRAALEAAHGGVYADACARQIDREGHGRDAPGSADGAIQTDLAEALGVHKGTVSKRMKKARETARSAIEPDEDWEATE